MIKYLQVTEMQMSGSLCRDGVPVTAEEQYKGKHLENNLTKTQRVTRQAD